MVDMNARMYSCCGTDVEVSGYTVATEDGKRGHVIRCDLCDKPFIVPGDLEAAKIAIPVHFRDVHNERGTLEDWHP